MRNTLYLTVGLIAFLGVFMFVGPVNAGEDNSAPQVTAINLSPSTVDTGDAGQEVTLTITLTDNLTGTCININGDSAYCDGYGYNSSSTQMDITPLIGTQRLTFYDFTLVSGDQYSGTYSSTITVPQYSKVGIWTISNLFLTDAIGNNKWWTGTQLAAMFPNSNLTIANTDDANSVTIEEEWEFSSSVAKVKFPASTVVTRNNGGSFEFYRMVNQAANLSELDGWDGVAAAIHVGIPDMGLIFSKYVEVSMYIEDESLVGEVLAIQTREDGDVDWTLDYACTVSINQYCTFDVTHASYFIAQVAPVRTIVTGTKSGGGPEVRTFDVSGGMLSSFDAYTNWWGGINVAVGDVNGDGTKEIITSTRSGGIPTIRIFDINGNNLGWDFDAFASGFRGGVSIAVGDIEGDGIDEIVVAPMGGGSPQVRIFGMRSGSIVPVTENFLAYDTNFRGGISVSIGDIEGDGIGDIITTPISGGGPHVRVFGARNGRFVPVTLGVMAYAESFHGGILTTTADFNDNGKDEIVTGIIGSGGPQVRMIGVGANKALAISSPGFMAFNPEFRGGVSVAAMDTNGNGNEEIIVGVGGQDVGWVKIMSATGTLLSPVFQAYGSGYTGGITLAAGVF